MSTELDAKELAKKLWAGFAPTEMATASVAPAIVKWAGIGADCDVLDVGCGTGCCACCGLVVSLPSLPGHQR